ncbi:glutamate synthase large subunit [Fredinandcohnia quinoae]|uniref:Glutamate synthase large subunit n=1 Tax=Fredinandcohnia quinoae TaxID=2918902 RepID=A0AAW5E5D3_9BACI|nr:glutamate synthase large subunit [Fredinandcohnia sp. SECRCQ15]MCH1624581.1 glutamate synthase large subunit [Fredinandcohnia sp. SECRCQ15]
MKSYIRPGKRGLYDPVFEHDACGNGFIVRLKGGPTHKIVEQGVSMLCRLEHRGGQGSDSNTGDGAGIMTQLPHKLIRRVCKGMTIPEAGSYGIGMIFLPRNKKLRERCESLFTQMVEEENQRLIGWRTVPTDDTTIGESAKGSQPFIRQILISKSDEIVDTQSFERKLYMIRKKVEKAVKETGINEDESFYIASLSARTIVYKGMLTPKQLHAYYIDLQDQAYESAFALVHSRFSTNTFPSWERAHPNRYLIHNGEINTLKGNVNWMKAREKIIESSVFDNQLKDIMPIIDENGSDSSAFDNCLEFLTLSGRSILHAAMMMVPQPWETDISMDDSLKAFYEYHSHFMEPWDGPAAFAFTDGKQIGAMLDRNGLRPGRYYITADGHLIFASEAGVLDIEPDQIIEKGRLRPGKMLVVDLEEGRIKTDEEVKQEISHSQPYRKWLDAQCVYFEQLPESKDHCKMDEAKISEYQRVFGYTYEEVTKHIKSMATEGKETIGSMGNDTPLAILSKQSQLLYNYFRQQFAQVTNPPIDAIREKFVTSTTTLLGAEGNLLNPYDKNYRRIRLKTPICTDYELSMLRDNPYPSLKTKEFSMLFDINKGEEALEAALNNLFQSVDEAIDCGTSLIILSDKSMNKEKAAIPSLLAVSGLHHHLVRKGTRTKVSILVETGEARDIHHFCMLIGYGADVINPYLAIATISEMQKNGDIKQINHKKAVGNYINAATSGIVKVLSKMGISTIQSYRGAQIFESIGISSSVIDPYFTGTSSRLGGMNLEAIAKETRMRHYKAYDSTVQNEPLNSGSDFQWRHDGEAHAYRPETIHFLQQACRTNDYPLYKRYAAMANEEQLIFLRGLFAFQKRTAIPVEDVESVESICRRFKTGAMSYGSLSQEAHETLAIAMNRIGGKSNSGEGGEHPSRFIPDENGDSRSSAIKQVASGRFGVTNFYLNNAEEIQIKMAQGAKPGEGGHLPGNKVYPWIAEVRGSTPGVGLISPPPHHDIYSIEDLAQLIHDLKNVNPKARISVKLVAKEGVGTIAAGVAKGLADVILISGSEGGTGAAPRTSIKHAGIPWEIGLAETHQTLLLNGLRNRVVLEADGKMMTGRDVVISALLGAEEYGFGTAPLVVLGCVLVRACHLNTCPVGIATQNPELRKKFHGEAEYIVNFMRFIAQDVREIMAELGFRTINEMVGQTDVLIQTDKSRLHWKTKDLNLSPMLYKPTPSQMDGVFNQKPQNHQLEKSLDYQELLKVCKPSLINKEPIKASFPIQNIHRTVGTILGGEITKRYGIKGLPNNTIQLYFKGSAGQSFGSFLPKGMTVTLEGDANDYVGKGLSGGKIIVKPCEKSIFLPEENTIIGNVSFYGGTSGEAYIRGLAGERFCVRNSGVDAVVEGIGDLGCEYMTGGRVVVLGSVGKHFAAGMSGGIAYVYTEDIEAFPKHCNLEMVYIESLNDDQEQDEVKQLVQNHYSYTNSSRARYILQNWHEKCSKWVKVIPKEYKRIMQEANRNEKRNIDSETPIGLRN